MIKYLLIFTALVLWLPVQAQQAILSGKITDSQGTPVPFTSIYVKGTTIGTSANENGFYRFKLKPGKYTVNYRFVGFKQQTEEVEVSSANETHNVQLTYEDYQLKQSTDANAEDPAIAIMRNAISKREYYLNEIKEYACDVYVQGTQKLLSAPRGMLSRGVSRELQLDTTRNRIMYLSESESRFSYQRPNKHKEVMISSQVVGNYNAFNFNRAADLQVNFYKNMFDIEGLNPRGFVSPVADNALKFYTYKLLGSATENGKLIHKIQVVPLSDHGPVFRGNIYIVDGDWRIYNAHLYLTKSSNLNFVDTLNVNQQFIPIKGNVWQPTSITFTYSGNVLGFKYYGYIIGVFSNYNVEPNFPKGFFNGETVRITNETKKRDSIFWANNRPVPLTPDEQRNYNHKDSILHKHQSERYQDSVERANNRFSPMEYVFFGDTVTRRRKKETFTLNPLYDVVSYNTVEGWVVDFKPTYNKKLNSGQEYTILPELRYGFDNQMVNFNTAFNYKFDPLNQGVFYAKAGGGLYDLNNEGTVGTFLNSFNTLFFKDNRLKLYRSRFLMAGVQRSVGRGVFLDGSLEYAIRNALQNSSNRTIGNFPDKEFTSNHPLIPELNAPLLFEQNNALTLKVSATYTFNEEYTSTPQGRAYDQSKYPKIKFSYRKGINGLGSDVDYDYADIQVFHDHINLGLYGYSSFLVTAGKFFNDKALIYPDYKQFRGNQGITFEPGISGFHFLPYYTYNNTTFLEAHYEHNFSGFVFNKVSWLRKLKLEEIVGGNYLAQKGSTQYGEFYIGVQRFFFRFDYGFVYRGNGRLDQGIKMYFGI